uniref:Putative secreted protein n=1 Tax=Ixodes scapularis TaxID=6945 RepID=A0A4D5S5E2_IXOSC
MLLCYCFLFSFAATSTILARILLSTHIRRIALYLRDRVDPGDKNGLPLQDEVKRTFGKRATRCVEKCCAVKQWRS